MSALLSTEPAPTGVGLQASIIVLTHVRGAHLAACLDSLRRHVLSDLAHEVIVFSNGLGIDDLLEVQQRFPEVRLQCSPVNLGFAGGCNSAARHARGRYLALLNDDATVEPGWLESMIDAIKLEPGVGAVGSRILRPDGSTEEAGCIVWRDGSTSRVGRDLPADTSEYCYRRPVDYCSAASLLIERGVWNEIGGMDEEYHPAYYEDVDLCFTLRARGLKTIYEPRSRIRHVGGASSSLHFREFLSQRNGHRFRDKWKVELAGCEVSIPGQLAASITEVVQRSRGWPRRILVVDDVCPEPPPGFGAPRIVSVAEELARGASVSFAPTAAFGGNPSMLQRLGIEVISEPLGAHLRRPEVQYSAIVVSRPHNYEQFEGDLHTWQPQAPIVYDSGSLQHGHPASHRTAEGDAVGDFGTAAVRGIEDGIATRADRIVRSFTAAADVTWDEPGHAPVDVVVPRPVAHWTDRGFWERSDAVLVASCACDGEPLDAADMAWFAQEVVPRLVERLPWARVRCTGGPPQTPVPGLSCPAIEFVGYVPDLAELYASARVAIVPSRCCWDVPIEALAPLLHGLPVVATTRAAEGIDAQGRAAMDITNDPAVFAECLVMLLDESTAWQSRHEDLRNLVGAWDATRDGGWQTVIGEMLDGGS